MLSSSSVLKHIEYHPGRRIYQTFDKVGKQTLRLSFAPKKILNGKELLPQRESMDDQPGWSFEPEEKVLKIHHQEADIEIIGEEEVF